MPEEKNLFQQIIDIEKEIKDLQPIVQKIKTLKEEKESLIMKAVEEAKKTNVYERDNLKLKNTPKKSNYVVPQAFQQRFPDIFYQIVKVPITKAKEMVGLDGLEGIVETEYIDNWKIIDLFFKEKGWGEDKE